MKNEYKGLPAQVMENEFLRLTFLPTYAFKLASIVSKKTGREFLFQSDSTALNVPTYGATYTDFDASGFDEIFPSFDPSLYPEGKYQGTPIPDHGEVWASPWQHVIAPDGKTAKATVESKKLPYVFTKNITLHTNEIQFEYTVENTGKEDFKFIWMPHILLNCSPDTRLFIPKNMREIISVEHTSDTLGPWGSIHTYPLTYDTHGTIMDLSETKSSAERTCERFFFTTPNTEGWCGVSYTDTDEQILYKYDALRVPYLAVWKSQGGFRGDYNLALEPCTGLYDDLYVANKVRRVSVVTAGDTYTWNFSIVIK